MTRTKKASMRGKRKTTLKRQTSAPVDSLASSVPSACDQAKDLSALLTQEYESPSHLLEAFKAFYEQKLNAQTKKNERCVDNVKETFANILKTYPENYLNGQLSTRYSENMFQIENQDLNVKTGRVGRPSRLKQKEPMEFKKPKTPQLPVRRTSRKRSMSAPTPVNPRPQQEFKTPFNNTRKEMSLIKTITPKVSNTPMSVMRRPQHGEIAFSTSGSPLLIAAVSREDIPTVSVPLMDGRVFSILPDPGLPPADLPEFDDDTKKYLRTLRDHLAMLSSP